MNRHVKKQNGTRWRDGLNKRLQDPKYAREYLLAAVEDGDDLHAALSDIVKAVGASRYASWTKDIERSNILRVVRKGSNPTVKTIDRLLAPLGLRIAVVRA